MYNLQQEIDNAQGYLKLPSEKIVISQTITLPANFILDGADAELSIEVNDYAFRIIGQQGESSFLRNDILPGGGIANQSPIVEVVDGSKFQVGDEVFMLQDLEAFPYKAEFNKIVAINGNHLTMQENFIQGFSATEQVRVIPVQLKQNVIVKNLKLVGAPGFNSFGIFANATRGLTLENIEFKDLGRKAIHVENSDHPIVQECQFKTIGAQGLGDYGLGIVLSTGATVKANQMKESGGVYLKGDLNAGCRENQIDNTRVTAGNGISIISTVFSDMSNNTVTRAKGYGMYIGSYSEQNIISKNVVNGGITSGIYLTSESNRNLITNNTLEFNHGNGISLQENVSENLVAANNSSKNESRGILVNGVKNSIVINLATDNQLEDIRIGNPDNFVKDNRVTTGLFTFFKGVQGAAQPEIDLEKESKAGLESQPNEAGKNDPTSNISQLQRPELKEAGNKAKEIDNKKKCCCAMF